MLRSAAWCDLSIGYALFPGEQMGVQKVHAFRGGRVEMLGRKEKVDFQMEMLKLGEKLPRLEITIQICFTGVFP